MTHPDVDSFGETNLQKQFRVTIEQTDPDFVLEKLKPLVRIFLRTMDVTEVEALLSYGFSKASNSADYNMSDSDISKYVKHVNFDDN